MFLEISDHNHHVVLAGPVYAPPLVLLHSLGTSAAVWQGQVDAFSGTHRVICPDFCGHGLSEISRERVTIESLVRDVESILDRLNVDTFSLAGISLGGVVAQAVAARAGARLGGLALFDTYVKTANPQMWVDRAKQVRAEGLTAMTETLLALWMTPDQFLTAEGKGLARMLALSSPEGYAAACDALANADNRAVVGTISAPTVVCCGTLDKAAPPEASRTLAELIPNARVEAIDEAAHIPLLHQSARCTEIIASVLQGP